MLRRWTRSGLPWTRFGVIVIPGPAHEARRNRSGLFWGAWRVSMLRTIALVLFLIPIAACSTWPLDDTRLSDKEYDRAISLITPSLISMCDKAAKGLFPGGALKRIDSPEGKITQSDYSKKISLSHAIHISYRSVLSHSDGNQTIGYLVCRFNYNKNSDGISFSGVFFD
jgi:hypothetical protein